MPTPTQVKTGQIADSSILKEKLDGALINGWIPANEAWAYASATTITVPSGAGAKYTKGDKIMFTQHGTVKYFYIIGVSDTVLTVVGNGSVVVENTSTYPITLNYSSHVSNPIGFPSYFTWVPTLTGGAADLSGYDAAAFSIEGCKLSLYFGASNRSLTGSSGQIEITLPVIPIFGSAGQWGSYTFYTGAYTYARCAVSTIMTLYKGMTSESWVGNETGVYINIFGSYWI